MVGFFKEVDICQGGDCWGIWLILRLEGLGKCSSCITSFIGGQNIRLGFAPVVRYDIFRVYRYFCNLVISRVIINTPLCNLIW